MAATVGDLSALSQALAVRGFCHVTICTPEYLGGTHWMVNIRRGAGWCVGSPMPTLEEAFIDTFEKAIPFSKRNDKQPAAVVSDDLDDLDGLLG